MSVDEDLDLAEKDMDGMCWKTPNVSALKANHPSGTESSIPQAEIESNAPYQPFHTDRRVGLHVCSSEEAQAPSPSVSALLSPLSLADRAVSAPAGNPVSHWAFGSHIKTVKLNVGPPQAAEDDYDTMSDHRALPSSAMERVLRIAENDEDMEQIVVTTRRRKGATRDGDVDEEGFFEDDCEVLDFASQRV
jgi:hypothetical protein